MVTPVAAYGASGRMELRRCGRPRRGRLCKICARTDHALAWRRQSRPVHSSVRHGVDARRLAPLNEGNQGCPGGARSQRPYFAPPRGGGAAHLGLARGSEPSVAWSQAIGPRGMNAFRRFTDPTGSYPQARRTVATALAKGERPGRDPAITELRLAHGRTPAPAAASYESQGNAGQATSRRAGSQYHAL